MLTCPCKKKAEKRALEFLAARAILDCLGLNSRAPPLAPALSPEPTDFELGFEEAWPSDEPDEGG